MNARTHRIVGAVIGQVLATAVAGLLCGVVLASLAVQGTLALFWLTH